MFFARTLTLLVSLAALLAETLGPSLAGEPRGESFGTLFVLVGDFALGAATSRTDYESVDSIARRLYIAKMGDGKLLVYDLAHNRLVREIADVPKITGVLAVPQLHRVYASAPGSGIASSIRVGLGMMGLSSGSGGTVIFDSETLKEV